jgi:hypothetical protein
VTRIHAPRASRMPCRTVWPWPRLTPFETKRT